MNDLAYYFDRIASEFNGYYTGQRPSLIQEIGYRIFRGPGLKKRFSDTIKIIGECKGAKILDVGCGPGVYALYFAKNGATVTGIDISQNMIDLARRSLLNSGIKNFNLILGNFLECELPDTFDYALVIGFFDYINKSKRDEYIDKLKRLAKKKIIATFPKRFVFQMPIRRALFLIKRQPVFFYTKGMIINMAKRHGLKACFHNSGPVWTVDFTKI